MEQIGEGTAIFTTDKNLYVTEVTQTTVNQTFDRTFQNVAQTINNIQNYPSGAINGLIQLNNGANFSSTTQLRWLSSSSILSVDGNVESRGLSIIGAGAINSFDLGISNNAIIQRLETVISANLGDVSRVSIAGGTLSAGLSSQADAFLKTDGAGTLSWATVNHVANGNYANFVGQVVDPAQPNIISTGSNLTVGSVELVGSGAQPVITGSAGTNVSIGATSGGANYFMVLDINGEVTLPTTTASISAIKNDTLPVAIKSSTSRYTFNPNNTANLANLVVANYFSGVFDTLSNTQPNITSLGTLTTLTVANTGATGNITSDNANLGNLVTANFANFANTITANLANVANLEVQGEANLLTANVRDIIASGNVVVQGNFSVTGTTVTVNTSTLQVADPIINMGAASGTSLSSNDGKDRGTVLHYYDASYKQAFMGWDNSNAEFVFSSDTTMVSDVATINTLGNIRANYILAKVAGDLTGNLVNGNSSVNVAANSNVVIYATSNATVDVHSLGVEITGTANFSGNISAANVNGGNLVTANNFTGNLVSGTSKVTMVSGGNVSLTAGAITSVIATTTGANIVGSLHVTTTANIVGDLTAGNLVTANNFTGNLVSGTSKVTMVSSGNVTITSAGNATAVVTGTGANITGNLAVTGNITATNFTGVLLNGTSNVTVDLNGNVRFNVGGTANAAQISSTGLTATTLNATNVNVSTAINTTSTGFLIANANATTINMGGAATTINLGAATGNTVIKNNAYIVGEVLSNASTFKIGSTSDDIEIGKSTTSTIRVMNDLIVTANIDGVNIVGSGNVDGAIVNATTRIVSTGTANITGAANVGSLVTTGLANVGSLAVTGTSNLNAVGNVTITGGSNTQFLQTNGSGVLKWADVQWGNASSGIANKVGSNGPEDIGLGKNAKPGANSVSVGNNTGSNTDETVSIGYNAGGTGQNNKAIAIGSGAGATNQGLNSVAIGSGAGATNQGTTAVAIGPSAGTTSQHDNSIIINATTGGLNSAQASSLFVKPIRTVGSIAANDHTNNGFTVQLWYNPTTGEIGAFTA
jgi:predicted regulator of Ras-like GTPase activity (Roadblock/LC7/MglB family)